MDISGYKVGEILTYKAVLTDKDLSYRVCNALTDDVLQYLDGQDDWKVGSLFSSVVRYTKNHLQMYNELPSIDMVLDSVNGNKQDILLSITNSDEYLSHKVDEHREYIKSLCESYIKDISIKSSIISVVNIMDTLDPNKNPDYTKVFDITKKAESVSIMSGGGTDYLMDYDRELDRFLQDDNYTIPTYYKSLDRLLVGGFKPKTLNLFLAKPHGHKSNMMANLISRQLSKGKRIALASLEMSEDMYRERFDSLITKLPLKDIRSKEGVDKCRSKMHRFMKWLDLKNLQPSLSIKEYPTGTTSNEIRNWLSELVITKGGVDILYVDYLMLMRPNGSVKNGDMYQSGKMIAEELRDLGKEFGIPVVSVCQINRKSTFEKFEDLSSNAIADSYGITATADTIFVMGFDDSDRLYENEMKWKCDKNRNGGRVGEVGKLLFDKENLKIYDFDFEMDDWNKDIEVSGDERNIFDRPEEVIDEAMTTRTRKRK